MLQDVRYAARMLLKSPGFAAVAVLTLALGIGANTAVFSLVNAVFLRMLPYPHAESLVEIEAVNPKGESGGVGPADFRDWREQSDAFQQMSYTWYHESMLAVSNNEPERVFGREVTDGFFPMLGVQPLLGRWFLPEEQQRGHNQVMVLSHGMWAQRFGARQDVLGQAVTLGRQSFTVVGVMPQGFRFNEGQRCDYWLPMQHWNTGRRIHMYNAYGRLQPGVDVATAQAQLSAIAKRLELAYPESNTGWGVRVTRMDELIRAEFGPVMLIFFVAVAVVLLIACANVANLLLARATARTREIAIRTALGAGRGSIVRLLLTESVLLALVAACLGLLLAQWGVEMAGGMAPATLELRSILYIDRYVLAFTLTLSVLTGVLTGLAPALAASRHKIGETLKQGGSATGLGVTRSRVLNGLVIAEVGLATLLLVASGLLLKSFVRLLDVNLGFRADHILTVNMAVPRAAYPEDRQRVEFYRTLTERVRNLPGVTSVGATWAMPLAGAYSGGGLEIEGRPQPRDWTETSTAYQTVTPGYFSTMGIPLLRGRDFTGQDQAGSEPVIIINEVLAHRYFPNEDVLGKRIRPDHSDAPWQTIVGVVGDVRHSSPERDPAPETYRPFAQQPATGMFLAVRTAVPPATLMGAVRSEIRLLERNAIIVNMRTMEQSLDEAIAGRRHLMDVIAFFAVLALLLAAIGLAGMMWYSVSRRTHEIGVRMALGARQSDMLHLVLWRGLRLALLGLLLGLAAAFGLTRLLQSLLFGVTVRDPMVFAAVPLVLSAVALAATYIPAHRASSVDPIVALRYE